MQVIKQVIQQNGLGSAIPAPKAAFASAAGKAIICGEHAVVYGSRSVAMPLTGYKMQADLRVVPNVPHDHIKIVLGDHNVSDNIRGVVRDAFHVFGIEPFPIHIDGRSYLPIGAGLGSSATLCVVVVRVLSQAIGVTLTPDQIAIAANQLEKRFHGKPSGLDTSVVAYEKIISFRSGEQPQPLDVSSGWQFALIDSGIRASTKTMIEKAAPYFRGAAGERHIAAFDEYADLVISGLRAGDETKVAEAMRATGDMLQTAGVVPGEMSDIITDCVKAGASAAKVTGAGGGGAVLALLPKQRDEADRVYENMRKLWRGRGIFRVEV